MRIFKSIIERAAQIFKGIDYKIDPKLPLTTLLNLSISRSFGLLRCVLRGVAFRPSGLVFVGPGVEFRDNSYIKFSRGVTLGKNVTIAGLSLDGVNISDGVNVGPSSVIEASATITDIGCGITIGSNSDIGAFSFIGGAGGVSIGNDVIMGQWVSFHLENHNYESLDLPIRLQGVNRKGIVVGDNCWVGAKVIFLDGAHVGMGCVIAAGSVVRGEIPLYSVAAGVPARVVKSCKESVSS